MSLKCCPQKQLFSGKAILKEHLSPLTILLKRLEPEPLVFENIANHSADFIKNTQSRTYFKCIFNSNILWNLEFAIFDFTRYTTLAHGARSPYSSLMRTEQNQIYLLSFTSFTVLCNFYEKSSPRNTFSYNRH